MLRGTAPMFVRFVPKGRVCGPLFDHGSAVASRDSVGRALGLDLERLDPGQPITVRMLGQPGPDMRSPRMCNCCVGRSSASNLGLAGSCCEAGRAVP